MKNSPLAKDFSILELIKYTIPSIFTMIVMSTYTIIDGVFVSTLVGESALAAINLIMPVIGIVMAVGLMFASGGNAVIAKLLGENNQQQAREFLTVLYLIVGIFGLTISTLLMVFPDQFLYMLGISGELYDLSKDYLLSMSPFIVPLLYMVFVQIFMMTEGKPILGFVLSLAGGLTNVVLDYLLISPNIMDLGIAGAGIATGIGYLVPGLLGFLYFMFNRKGILCFVKPKLDMKTLLYSMFNGSSELVGSLATSVTTLMFNFILLDMAGEAGVAAISAILYIQMFQSAIYNGYCGGVASIIAFKYGEQNHESLRKVINQSFKIIAVSSVIVIVLSLVFSEQAVGIFISKDSSTFEMAKNGFLLFLPSYAFMGFNLFLSSMFTSLSNGKVSATISVLRTLVFIVISLMILPKLFGINGVWLAIPFAELLSILVSVYFYKKNKEVYNY